LNQALLEYVWSHSLDFGEVGIAVAEDEVPVLFSTANAFCRQEKSGASQLLKEAASRGVEKIVSLSSSSIVVVSIAIKINGKGTC
jgi:hypothetical protein